MDLAKAIEDGSLTKEDLSKIIYQIAEGMKYIHFKKVIHRDLKPTNILIEKDGTIKIGDILKGKKAEIPSSFTEFSKNMINNCWNFETKDGPSFETIVESRGKNHYDLVDLNPTEVKNDESFVKQHQAKLPKY
ncbi:Cyclin-dependent kinase 4 [Tritrichomonas musculus]|uniref:non-specific serine/threonine protein kinase n=1 Tax=Tritrichomonas musculus TaxID=1915356 RepID=A0ABR2H0R4_9EUKA